MKRRICTRGGRGSRTLVALGIGVAVLLASGCAGRLPRVAESTRFASCEEAQTAVRKAGRDGVLLRDRGYEVFNDPYCYEGDRFSQIVFEEWLTVKGERCRVGSVDRVVDDTVVLAGALDLHGVAGVDHESRVRGRSLRSTQIWSRQAIGLVARTMLPTPPSMHRWRLSNNLRDTPCRPRRSGIDDRAPRPIHYARSSAVGSLDGRCQSATMSRTG